LDRDQTFTVVFGCCFPWSTNESLLDEEEVLSSQTEITAEMGYNFWFHSSIELNVLHELPEAVVVVVPAEFLFGEEHGLPRETKTTAEKDYNFLSDRWIALKLLQ
jgi:hypothetical protein